MAELLPPPGLMAGHAEHQPPERQDQAGLLRKGDELVRIDEPALGVAPPHERFDTDDAPRLERDDRLIVELELACRDGPLELGLEGDPVEDLRVHRRLEERKA